MSGAAVAFAILAGLVLFSAWRVVTSEQIAHSALFLGLTFVSMAGLFILLQAPTFALLHVLVYVGAVLTVVVFAIMLSDPEELRAPSPDQPLGERLRRRLLSPYYGWIPVVVTGALAAVILFTLAKAGLPAVPQGEPAADDLRVIGREMFTRYSVPFEIASAALLAALIGAIGLTRRDASEAAGRRPASRPAPEEGRQAPAQVAAGEEVGR